MVNDCPAGECPGLYVSYKTKRTTLDLVLYVTIVFVQDREIPVRCGRGHGGGWVTPYSQHKCVAVFYRQCYVLGIMPTRALAAKTFGCIDDRSTQAATPAAESTREGREGGGEVDSLCVPVCAYACVCACVCAYACVFACKCLCETSTCSSVSVCIVAK